MPPLRADAERNRQRLLAAAREVFAARGLDATLDEIARHAGVGTGTAYRRFANKDVLIEELMAGRLVELQALAEESLAEPDPWRGLAGFFERALQLMAADRGLKQVLLSSGRGGEQVDRARQALAVTGTRLVQRAVEAGVARPDLAATDIPLINIMASTVMEFGGEVEPELYRRYLAILLDGLRARPGAEPLPVEPLDVPRFVEAFASWRR
jgi:AcrR family transcriptional regulator